MSDRVSAQETSADYPSVEAMKAAVSLEIEKCLGIVTTQSIGHLIQKAIDASLESSSAVERLAVNEDVAGSKPASPAIPPQEMTVWLIEWPEDANVPVRWWNPAHGWMRDANKALHFARKTDADCYLSTMRFGLQLKVTEHKFCSAVMTPSNPINWTEVEEARRLANRPTDSIPAARPNVSIKPMQLADGRTDYFVSIKVGDREVTPHVFREEYKSAYHVALYDWLLNGTGEEPDLVKFGPDDWPAQRHSPAGSSPELEAILKDPAAVHLNMLRGGIAMPALENIKHLYPEVRDAFAAVEKLKAADRDHLAAKNGMEKRLTEQLARASDWREPAANYLDWQAEMARNSLHCGDNSVTIQSTHRYAQGLRSAAKLIRNSPPPACSVPSRKGLSL